MKITVLSVWIFCVALTNSFLVTPSYGKKQASSAIISERSKKLHSHPSGLFLVNSKAAKAIPVVAKATESTITTLSGTNLMAKTLGYLMGAGSLLLYSPIILKLLNTKQADGFSELT